MSFGAAIPRRKTAVHEVELVLQTLDGGGGGQL